MRNSGFRGRVDTGSVTDLRIALWRPVVIWNLLGVVLILAPGIDLSAKNSGQCSLRI